MSGFGRRVAGGARWGLSSLFGLWSGLPRIRIRRSRCFRVLGRWRMGRCVRLVSLVFRFLPRSSLLPIYLYHFLLFSSTSLIFSRIHSHSRPHPRHHRDADHGTLFAALHSPMLRSWISGTRSSPTRSSMICCIRCRRTRARTDRKGRRRRGCRNLIMWGLWRGLRGGRPGARKGGRRRRLMGRGLTRCGVLRRERAFGWGRGRGVCGCALEGDAGVCGGVCT